MPVEIESPQRAKGMVHHQIAATAKGLAEAQWEVLARQNAFYKAFPKADRYVRKHWPEYIPMARQIMAAMLGSPKYDDAMKKKIKEALLLDGAVNPKKMAEPAKPAILFSK